MLPEDIKNYTFVTGTKQTIRSLGAGKAGKVFLAQDANSYIRAQVAAACQSAGVEYEDVESMKTLGSYCGISRSAAAAAIIKSE